MKTSLCLIALVLTFCGQVLADQITLKNGDRVTGKMVKSDGGKLLVETELLGDVSIDLSSIVTITGDQPVYVTLADGRTVNGVLTASADKAELRAANSTVVAVKRSTISVIRSEQEQLAYERSLNPGLLEGWSGGADLGLALTSGNSDTTNFALGLSMTRATRRDKTSIYAASVYSRDSTSGVSRTVANTVRAGVRYDHDINKKFFVYVFTDLEHNGLQDLTLRLVPGGGLGYHLIRNDRTQLDLLGGLALNREYFKGDFNDRSSAEAQVGQTLSHKLNSRVSLTEQLFIFPNLTNGGEYRVNFDGGLVTSISRRIGWQLTLSDRYLSNPPPGLEKNDLLLTTGLKIKLGEPK
jgi:putative salt-induced outer membrane protein YdiY